MVHSPYAPYGAGSVGRVGLPPHFLQRQSQMPPPPPPDFSSDNPVVFNGTSSRMSRSGPVHSSGMASFPNGHQLEQPFQYRTPMLTQPGVVRGVANQPQWTPLAARPTGPFPQHPQMYAHSQYPHHSMNGVSMNRPPFQQQMHQPYGMQQSEFSRQQLVMQQQHQQLRHGQQQWQQMQQMQQPHQPHQPHQLQHGHLQQHQLQQPQQQRQAYQQQQYEHHRQQLQIQQGYRQALPSRGPVTEQPQKVLPQGQPNRSTGQVIGPSPKKRERDLMGAPFPEPDRRLSDLGPHNVAVGAVGAQEEHQSKKARRFQEGREKRGGCGEKKGGGVEAEIRFAEAEARRLGTRLPRDNSEEIEKWVTARLANWPTKANRLRKQDEARQRAERGELEQKKQQRTLKEAIAEKRSASKRPHGHAVGRSELPAAPGALGAIAAHYAGDSSGEEDLEKESGVDDVGGEGGNAGKTGAVTNGPAVRVFARPVDGARPIGAVRKRKARRSGKGKKKGKGPQSGPPPLPKAKPTLLRKLLQPEIRREQSLLLQCLRVLVQHDFNMETSNK